jgi:hypothetical protein
MRALAWGLTLLHLGPGLAFALLAFGCDGEAPGLAALCARGLAASFGLLTAASWALLGAVLAAAWLVLRARRSTPPAHAARAQALAALLLCGVGVGAATQWLSGSAIGFLAVPAAVIAGWLAVADPAACEPGSDRAH